MLDNAERPKPDPDAAVEFLQAFRPDGPWTLIALYPEGVKQQGNDHGRAPTKTFTDPDRARAWIERRALHANIYFQPNAARIVSEKPSKEDLTHGHVAQVDCDRDEKGKRLIGDEAKEAKLAELLACKEPGPPTWVTDSGNGLQAFWRFDVPVEFDSPDSIREVEEMSLALAQRFGADHCHAANQMFRLPGTINYPSPGKVADGAVPTPTRVMHHDPEAEYEGWMFRRVPLPTVTYEGEIHIGEAMEVSDLGELVAEYNIPPKLVALIEHGHDPDDPDRLPSPSEWLWAALNMLLRAGVEPEVILGIILNPAWGISASVYDEDKRKAEAGEPYARRQVTKAIKKHRIAMLQEFQPLDDDQAPASSDVESRSLAGLSYQRADEIEAKPLNPLWPGRFYIGKLTTLAGIPDQGKSVVTCDIAARVSRGAAWPDGEGHAPLGMAIILSAEDDPADTITPRLMAAGAALDKVLIINSLVADKSRKRMFSIADDLHRLTLLVRRYPDTRLLIIDPANAYMGTSKEHDSFRDSDVRAVLGPVKEWAEEHQIAVLIVTHFKKGGSGRAIDQVMGSLAFTALSRSAWAFIEEKDGNGVATGRKLMARIKQNISAPVDALTYRLVGVEVGEGIPAPKVEWGEEVIGSADDLMTSGQSKRSPKLNAAMSFLLELLTDAPAPVAQIMKAAREAGHAEKTLNRARAELGVESYQEERQWFWRLGDTEVPTL